MRKRDLIVCRRRLRAGELRHALLRQLQIAINVRPAFGLLLLGMVGGCAMTIRPPRDICEPTTVFLVDYQHHASLFLPNNDSGFSEFAYGEWKWFAENHEGVLDAIRIALFPSKGTLGRRVWPEIDDAEALKTSVGFQAVYPVTVEKLRAAVLLRHLNDDFERDPSQELFNHEESMTFVPHRDVYWMGWNCNTAAAAWLESLDCEVRGLRLFAEFRIAP